MEWWNGMVEWNSGMEYWNDLLSLKSDIWGAMSYSTSMEVGLRKINVGTSHQKNGPCVSTAACQSFIYPYA